MGKFVDLTGRVFGRLTVIKRVENSKPTKSNRFGLPQYECQCSCDKHTILVVPAGALTTGHTQSCGCLKSIRISEAHLNDLTGKTFGRLIVIKRDDQNANNGKAKWICQCSCPSHTIISVTGSDLIAGNTKSCGCLKSEVTAARNIFSRKWKTDTEQLIMKRYGVMKQRCYDKSCDGYKDYGARGIFVCDEWRNNPRAFVDWALQNGFHPDLELDRKNEPPYDKEQNGPYAPWNCRWVTKITQTNNTRNNVFVEIDGERLTVTEWSRKCGVPEYTLRRRLKRGYQLFKDIVMYNLSLKKGMNT